MPENERANGMKRILFLVTALLMVFSFNISSAQNVKIDQELRGLARNIWKYSDELQSIQNDLVSIAQAETVKSYKKASLILDLADDVERTETIMQYEFFILVTKPFIDEDKMKPYCQHIFHTLEYSMMQINSFHKHLQDIYDLVENKAALHSADKAKKIIKDSLTEIESTSTFLDNAIKAMP